MAGSSPNVSPDGRSSRSFPRKALISHLKENGRAVVLLPNGSLTTQNSAELDIRKKILYEGLVEVVITLPAGLFTTLKFRVVYGL
ncbi:N-6 DNA methylase [Lachnotalea sp. AF33-28]|uniref:N-6 DNA methylase n=1 Tax=Lachnotalea sp. AF33-28 TaxID=2292046 RepID=UPI000E4F6C30|nr:hypothetical protein DWZ56_07695 [Lachnotalea sp. AF33-28]